MIDKKRISEMKAQGRKIDLAQSGDTDLGPLKDLPGRWSNKNLPGRGWNMIALPKMVPDGEERIPDFRLLMNQYNEELKFTLADKAVANRGIRRNDPDKPDDDTDQIIVALDYEQRIQQIEAAEFPVSKNSKELIGGDGKDIHHEPGLWIHMTNETTDGINIGRLGTIPHGNSVLALGRYTDKNVTNGAPNIPAVNGLPIGRVITDDGRLERYHAPYNHFHTPPFKGIFSAIEPHKTLIDANEGIDIVKTTELTVDTEIANAGILNIPFIEKQADATQMKSTFWIQELAEKDGDGNPKLRLQYMQIVMLDFFSRDDGFPGLVKWPHISINTMEKIEEKTNYNKAMGQR